MKKKTVQQLTVAIKSWSSIWKVKIINQKLIHELRSQFKKSILNLKSENQMFISEVRKSTFKYSLLTFNFDHPLPGPLPFSFS